jgi:hypothetical protein
MRIEVLLAEFPDPAHTPSAERLDDVDKLLSALGQ